MDALFYPLAQHHRFISFSIYTVGIVAFVLNLRKGHYKFQFSQLAFTHMILLFVVFQANFIACSIFEGLFWFVFPISLVICNDIMAYFFGFFFGRTPLIKLSPKKTWEGFWGALFSTIIFGFFFSGFLASIPYLICPVRVNFIFSYKFIDNFQFRILHKIISTSSLVIKSILFSYQGHTLSDLLYRLYRITFFESVIRLLIFIQSNYIRSCSAYLLLLSVPSVDSLLVDLNGHLKSKTFQIQYLVMVV